VVYQAQLVVVAVGFPLAARASSRAVPDHVSGVVVQLDPNGGLSGFAHALGSLVDDPDLQLLEWDEVTARYVDAGGEPAHVAAGGETLLVQRDGRPLAAVRHRLGALSSPGMARAVESAVRLAVQHARLRREEARLVSELAASRRRLQISADTQRARIENRLRQRVASPARALARTLQHTGTTDGEADALVRSAEVELVAVATQLSSLADRLPAAPGRGLDAALAELARRSAMTVHIGYDVAVPLPAEAATAAYFVCAEALANTAKHSGVASANIGVEAGDGALRVQVRDDGVGGASLSGGTGLLGLADRVAAIGGRLVLESPAGGPTTATATMPLSADPQPGV
jgi:hypothetical protein